MTLQEAIERLDDLYLYAAMSHGGYPNLTEIVGDKIVVAGADRNNGDEPTLRVFSIEEAIEEIEMLEDVYLENIERRLGGMTGWYHGDNLANAIAAWERRGASEEDAED